MMALALILVGMLTLASGSISSVDMLSGSWKDMEQRMTDRSRTEIDCTDWSVTGGGADLHLTVQNNGQVALGQFDRWDIILQYHGDSGYYVKWLPYNASSPGDNEWTVEGIYFEGEAETIEPGRLNTGEEAELLARLDPTVGANTTNMAVVSTANGVTCEEVFRG